ncbi:hypothetical protein Q3A66_14150 [Hymenobacter sp. BT770]|uniref:hypothetical protein n=1 Tax=Hymenobacter sp. BT770 TaxID=2886942 RepID=UPI001D130050|nr:hypothetical protein [Hymenobacter sp. BT770]MCC3154064.1 hypothetical protein [Hymenobacter sp. BT770]MDO3416208.1 hypothetical protein [Hymenobacter sp. BT770]
MPFPYSSGRLLLVGAVLVGATASAQAQRPARVATHADSVRAARNAKITYAPALFTLLSGKQVRGYVTSYALFMHEQVECYETPPDQLPHPPIKALAIERIKTMVVEGHTLDALTKNGKPLGMLAENMTPAAGTKTYGYFITKADLYIPIPLPVGVAVIPVGSHDKYFWYVQPTGGTIQEVPRSGKAFAALMATAFADYPELAARVRQQAPGAEYKNMPTLVQEYNAHFPAK